MRLKSLSLCLFALSLSGCSSHVIKSNNSSVNTIDQRAIQATNAMFEYPSYDYNGTFKFDIDAEQSIKNGKQMTQEQRVNDPELEKQVRAVLKAQRINLNNAQLQQLYQAISSEEASDTSSTPRSKKIEGFIIGLLSEMQFSYDGSVHYKQKLGSMNLTAKYEKPTLLVQAKVPMIVDFKDYKFYTNYFALMPLMVNKESQSTLAYVDFSKYKNEFEKLDLKNLVTYVKESSALPYVLANAKDIQTVSLNAQDKAQGAVEKIRLNISLEEWMLQSRLYEQVNEPYFKEKMKVLFPEDGSTGDASAEEVVADDTAKVGDDLSAYGLNKHEAEAYQASQDLYQLINSYVLTAEAEDAGDEYTSDEEDSNGYDNDEDNACSSAEDCVDAAAVAVEEAEASAEESYLSEAECRTLVGQAKRPVIGDVAYCDAEYDIDILAQENADNASATSNQPSFVQTILSKEQTELDKVFEQYASNDFKDAKAFKVLWDKHQVEVTKELSRQGNNPVVMDVALDDKGRAVRYDYDVSFKTANSGTLKFKTDMNILNYGDATPINRADLNRAKSIEEVSKNSIMENMLKGFSKSLGVDASQPGTESNKSLDQQLDDLAKQVYDTTQSYVKTYQALFILKMSAEQPEVVKLYSSAELNEIARVYAYAYADEHIYNPQAKEKAEIERLMKKHHLELNSQFNGYVGEEVHDKVKAVIESKQERQQWNKFVQQHKTAKSAFSEYYVTEFLADFEEDDLDATQKKELRHVAQILAQAYDDTRKNKLTEKSIQTLTVEDTSYIDYALYRSAFEKVSASFK